MTRKIVQVEVTDVEKRRIPSKHYVYIIEVYWSDGSRNVIYRRYTEFFDLQVHLLDKFPTEAGTKNPSQRCIPFLPGKKLFVRSHTYEVAISRLKPIRQYCKDLIKLPDNITLCDRLLKFFEVKDSDLKPKKEDDSKGKNQSPKPYSTDEVDSEMLNAETYMVIGDYMKVEKNEISLIKGTMVDVIQKRKNGWWFVTADDDQGWAPASYLRKVVDRNNGHVLTDLLVTDVENELYVSTADIIATKQDEVQISKGTPVEVLKKSETGWWLVRNEDKIGLAPRQHLERPAPGANDVFNSAMMGRNSTAPYSHKDAATPQSIIDLFEPDDPSCIRFNCGESATVLEKCGDWWFVKIANEEGWAPAAYLEKASVRSFPSPRNSPGMNKKEIQNLQSAVDVKDRALKAPIVPNRSVIGPKASAVSKTGEGSRTVKERKEPSSSAFASKPTIGVHHEQANNQDHTENQGIASSKLQQLRTNLKHVPLEINRQKALPSAGNSFVAIASKHSRESPTAIHKVNAKKPDISRTQLLSKTTETQTPSNVTSVHNEKVKEQNTNYNQMLPKMFTKTKQAKAIDNFTTSSTSTTAVASNCAAASESAFEPSVIRRPVLKNKEIFCSMYDYKGNFEGAIDIKEGDQVEVIEKNDDGWWLVKNSDLITGYVPGNFLKLFVPKKPTKPPRPVRPKNLDK